MDSVRVAAGMAAENAMVGAIKDGIKTMVVADSAPGTLERVPQTTIRAQRGDKISVTLVLHVKHL
jgi:hypothetical protein